MEEFNNRRMADEYHRVLIQLSDIYFSVDILKAAEVRRADECGCFDTLTDIGDCLEVLGKTLAGVVRAEAYFREMADGTPESKDTDSR